MAENQAQNETGQAPDAYIQGEITRETAKARIFGLKFSLWMRGILSGIFFCVFSACILFIVLIRFDDNLLRSVGSLFATPIGIIIGYWFGYWTQR